MNKTMDTFSQHSELKYLLRALQLCNGFGLYFARCNSVLLRSELVSALKEKLDKPIIELILKAESEQFIDVQVSELLINAPANAVVFIYDLDKLFYLKERHVISELNWRREYYGRTNHAIVFWLPDFLLTEIFNHAADFIDWRSGVYEFSLARTEQLQLMQSTWENASENFVEQLTLAEKERWIIQLKNLLDDIKEQLSSKTKGDLLNRLGQLYCSLGNYEKALIAYQQSLKISQDIGDKQGEAATLNNISQIYKVKGDIDTALDYLKKSLQITQDIGNKEGEGATLNNISQIYTVKGDYDTALAYLKQSLKIRQDIGDKQGEGVTLNNISQIYKAKGNIDMALDYLKQSLITRQNIGDKQGEGIALNNMSQIYYDKGDIDTALDYLKQSLKIRQEIGDKAGECTTLFNIGLTYLEAFNNNEQGIAMLLQAYLIAKQIGLAQILQSLEQLAKQMGGTGLENWEQLNQQDLEKD
ncbi:MAG: tetratricopeptide repeat protein [Methylococcaceae bacterium]